MKKLCLSIVATSVLLSTLSTGLHSAKAQVTPIEEKTYIQGNKISSQNIHDGTTYYVKEEFTGDYSVETKIYKNNTSTANSQKDIVLMAKKKAKSYNQEKHGVVVIKLKNLLSVH